MIDGHIHLERGSYTLEWANKFVNYAQKRGISEIRLLEHTFRFTEFCNVFKSISGYNEFQKEWLDRKMQTSLDSYKSFIVEMRKIRFPIKVYFGLEVCYLEDSEDSIKELLSGFDWDFVTGSVHWIDGWGFDHRKEFWEGRDIDATYRRYYEIMKNLIKSGLFSTLAHPDSIKCFGHLPTCDLKGTYCELADLLNKYQMSAEQSAGLFINYGCRELGMNPDMLGTFKKKGVRLITVSDAHQPEDVGKFIKEL
ncbi:MAG: PHP domain-containing protein [Bacillota bacterium]|nr:PHP domain-containing protein [Bacillota bacterium]